MRSILRSNNDPKLVINYSLILKLWTSLMLGVQLRILKSQLCVTWKSCHALIQRVHFVFCWWCLSYKYSFYRHSAMQCLIERTNSFETLPEDLWTIQHMALKSWHFLHFIKMFLNILLYLLYFLGATDFRGGKSSLRWIS